MKGYHKSDVDTHGEGSRREHPAINVKVRRFIRASDVEREFGCSEDVAEKAVEFAFSLAQETFWENVEEIVSHYFGGCKFWQEGRQGGWLVVDAGNPDDWDAITLNKWALLERAVKAEIAWLCDPERVLDDIRVNRWAEEGAEQYNFRDTPAGPACMVDVKNTVNAFARGAFGFNVL